MVFQTPVSNPSNILDNWELVLPRWNNSLTEEHKRNGQEVATNVLIYIFQTTDVRNLLLLNQKSRCFYKALSFLLQDDVNEILIAFTELLTTKKYAGNEIHLASIKLDISDLNYFYTVVFMSMSCLSANINISNETAKQQLLDLVIILFSFTRVSNAYAGFATKSIYFLVKKHISHINLEQYEYLIKATGKTYMSVSSDNKAIQCCGKITQLLVKQWSVSKRTEELAKLFYYCTWDSYDCLTATYLLNLWPLLKCSDLRASLASCICEMLMEKNSSNLKVLDVSLPHLSLEIWNNKFSPILIELIPDNLEEQTAYVNNVLKECVKSAVKCFGADVYKDMKKANYNIIYASIVLYYEIQRSQDISEYYTDIKNMLYSCNITVQNYAFQALCVCNNKHFTLKNWQLALIIDYLEMATLEVDIHVNNELHYLFSHICITANNILRMAITDELNTTITSYVLFINGIYRFCLENITSKSFRRISFGSKIFILIQRIFREDSKSLKTKYNISKQETYDKQSSPFFKYLLSKNQWYFDESRTQNILIETFYESRKVYSEIPFIILNWFSTFNDVTESARFYDTGIHLLSTKYDYESIEKGCSCVSIVLSNESISRYYCDILVEFIHENLLNKRLCLQNYEDLVSASSSSYGLLKCTLCLLRSNVYLTVSIKTKIFRFCKQLIYDIVNVNSTSYSPQFNIYRKVIEYTVIGCLDNILWLLDVDKEIDKGWFEQFLEISRLVIEKSNMKKPINIAINHIHKLCLRFLSVHNLQYQPAITKFLETVLVSICDTSECQTSKIRKSPEHRLLIHAIVTAESSSNHMLFLRTLNFFNEVLCDTSSSSRSIVPILHTMEILISDNSLRSNIHPFLVQLTTNCITRFEDKEWTIRNAAMQVLQSLVVRILGQKTNGIQRHNPVDEVFMLYPDLASYFYSVLQDTDNISDSGLAVLSIFSESHSKLNAASNRDIHFIIDSFIKIFIELICTCESKIGKHSAKAFVALYPLPYIPFAIYDIVEWLKENFCSKTRNIFCTCMSVLELMYNKFNIYTYAPYYNIGMKIIKFAFQNLNLFLEKYYGIYGNSLFNLLNIRLNNIEVAIKSLKWHLGNNDYQSRLWLNNYVSYILNSINIADFCDILMVALYNTSAIHLQICCLNSILNRFQELRKQHLINNLIDIVIAKFIDLNNSCNYLIVNYSHVLILLSENTTNQVSHSLMSRIRAQYDYIDRNNLFIVSAFVSILSHFKHLNDLDVTFIKNTLGTFMNMSMMDDSESHYHISIMLKYLYKCTEPSDRHDIFKICFILLMEQDHRICLEVCNFIAFAFNVRLYNIYASLNTLISHENLLYQFGNIENVLIFLVDILIFISSLDDTFIDNGQFYLKQMLDITIHKNYLRKILLKEIKNVAKLLPKDFCMKLLCKVQNFIKDK